MRRVMCLAVCAMILLIVSRTVSAEGIDVSPKLVGSSDALVNVSWTLQFTSGLPSEVTLKAFVFPNTTFQKADILASSHSFSIAKDSFGNTLATFVTQPSQQSELFWMLTRVKAEYQYSSEIALESKEFLKESPLVLLSPEARTLSQSVLSDAQGERALAIATHWAHENVAYDLSYWQRNTNSQETLSARAGVCKDLTHVESALLRSKGIPTRFVAGFVYSGKEWGPHAWLEAAIDGEWVSADPTYNEARVLDATHLAFARGRDQGDIREEILTRPFTFNPSTIILDRDVSVEFSYENFTNLARLSVGELGGEFGSLSVVEIPWEITAVASGIYPLEVILPSDVKVLGEKTQLHSLNRGESASGMYRVQLPELNAGFSYTFPFEFSTLGAQHALTIRGKSDGVKASVSDVSLSEVSATVTREGILSIISSVQNSGSTNEEGNVSLEFLGKENVQSFSIASGEKKNIVFTVDEPQNATRGAITLAWSGGNTRQAFTYTPQERVAAQQTFPDIDDSTLFIIAAAVALIALAYALAKTLKNVFR